MTDARIGACHNAACSRLHGSVDVPTRFILPWATDPESQLRRDLNMQPLTSDDVTAVYEGLRDFLPNAFLFLRKLNKAMLLRNGELVLTVERLADGDDVLITTDGTVRVWRVFQGEFEAKAGELRASGVPIDAKRRAHVSVAVPEDPAEITSGLLFAFLPTQHRTGLPIHVNADFYPSSDRKRIILEGSYQALWNEAALTCANSTLAANLESLHEFTGAERFWGIMEAAERVSGDASSTPRCLDCGPSCRRSSRVRRSVLAADGVLRLPEAVRIAARIPSTRPRRCFRSLGSPWSTLRFAGSPTSCAPPGWVSRLCPCSKRPKCSTTAISMFGYRGKSCRSLYWSPRRFQSCGGRSRVLRPNRAAGAT